MPEKEKPRAMHVDDYFAEKGGRKIRLLRFFGRVFCRFYPGSPVRSVVRFVFSFVCPATRLSELACLIYFTFPIYSACSVFSATRFVGGGRIAGGTARLVFFTCPESRLSGLSCFRLVCTSSVPPFFLISISFLARFFGLSDNFS